MKKSKNAKRQDSPAFLRDFPYDVPNRGLNLSGGLNYFNFNQSICNVMCCVFYSVNL